MQSIKYRQFSFHRDDDHILIENPNDLIEDDIIDDGTDDIIEENAPHSPSAIIVISVR